LRLGRWDVELSKMLIAKWTEKRAIIPADLGKNNEIFSAGRLRRLNGQGRLPTSRRPSKKVHSQRRIILFGYR
jgi:hypothetical protein